MSIFKDFVLTEDKKLSFEAQQYLLENLDEKLNPSVDIDQVDELRIKTNIGFDRSLKLVSAVDDDITRAQVKWWSTSTRSPFRELKSIVEHVNSCVASLKNYDICLKETSGVKPQLQHYTAIEAKTDQDSGIFFAIKTDHDVAGFFFKLFPNQVVNVLIENGIYDREKTLEAYEAKTIDKVIEQLGAKLRIKLITAIISYAKRSNDERDIKELIKGCDMKELMAEMPQAVQADLKLQIEKANRSQDDRDFDDNNDRFIFVGYEKFVPVPGTKHHKKTLEIENFYKVDRFDMSDHQAMGMMKMRARMHNGDVYLVSLPKGAVEAKSTRHSDLPEWLIDLIDEHKQKI